MKPRSLDRIVNACRTALTEVLQPDLARTALVALGNRRVAYTLHLACAALFFSPFLLFGRVLSANTDMLTLNYPLMLLAKRNFLHGVIGLWDPYILLGVPSAAYAVTPQYFPENWLLFLLPERFFFPALTCVSFLKLWAVGVASYWFYRAELGNGRWALFASLVYQLCGYTVFAITSYDTLSVFLYDTTLLALIWTVERRSLLANYLLMSAVTTLMLFASNISYCAYAMLGAGILVLYRAASRPAKPALGLLGLFTATSLTGMLIFCVRLLPMISALDSYDRGCCSPDFRNASFLLARFFDTEIFGINYIESQSVFPNISPAFADFHLHWVMPDYYGVAAALLVVWGLVSRKSPRAVFWSVYVVVATELIVLAPPFDTLARVLLSPIHHVLSLHILPPIGVGAMAAIGGAALERQLKSRGRVSKASLQLFAFALTVLGLYIVVIFIRNVPSLAALNSMTARLVVAGLIILGIGGTYICPRSSVRARVLSTAPIFIAAICAVAGLLIHRGTNATFISYLRNISCELLAFTWIGVTLWRAEREQTRASPYWHLGTVAVLGVCVGVTLYPWTPALRQLISHDQVLMFGAFGAVRLVVALCIFFSLVALIETKKLPARSVYIVFLALVFAEQVPAGKVHSFINTNPFYPAETFYPDRPAPLGVDGKPVNLDLADYRVNFPQTMLNMPFYAELYGPANEICASINAAYGIRAYSGYYNIMPTRTAAFFHNWVPKPQEPATACIYGYQSDPRFLDLSGVGYAYDPQKKIVMRRDGALSRLMLFTNYEAIASDPATLSRLKADNFEPLHEIVLQQDPGFASYSSSDNGRPLAYKEITPDHLDIEVVTAGPAVVLFDDSFADGWTATVNGKPAHISRANYNFMSVLVPAGTSSISFEYWPRSFVIGTRLGIAGILVLAMAFVIYVARRIRARGLPQLDPRRFVPGQIGWFAIVVLSLSVFQVLHSPAHWRGRHPAVPGQVLSVGDPE